MEHSEEPAPWPGCSSRSRPPGQTAVAGHVEGAAAAAEKLLRLTKSAAGQPLRVAGELPGS